MSRKFQLSIPSHYRQLREDETIRKGDFGKTAQGKYFRVKNSIGMKATGFNTTGITFWRRKHVRVLYAPIVPLKGTTPNFPWGEKQEKAKKVKHPIEKTPLVSFMYPRSGWRTDDPKCNKLRHVRLIAADNKYFIGIEILGGNRFQFKKFLKSKASQVAIAEFNPEVIS